MHVTSTPARTPDLAALADRLRGTLILPADAGYDEARLVWNAMVDHRPAAIARVADTEDVATAVHFARQAGLPISVRSGGHSLTGLSVMDGALVVDLSGLKGLHIHPERRVAWAQPGLTAGEFTRAAAEHGLATPFGDTASVGLGGLTLGGGIGYLVRKLGLTVDSLLAVELVTADGDIIVASDEDHTELFWAVRGGGGNFGIATRIQYRLHEVGQVLGGMLVLPASREVLRGMIDIAAAAPDELSIITFVGGAPPAPFIPEDRVGEPVAMITLVYAGDPAEGERVVAPLRALATPVADLLGPMPYPGIYDFTAEAEVRQKGIHRSAFLDRLDDDMIDATLEAIVARPTPLAMVQLRVLGGRMARVGRSATAFAHRDAAIVYLVLASPEDDPEPSLAWTEALFERVRPAATGVYVNFLEDEGEARIREAYPAATYERLADVKRRYDLENVFRFNQNIRPAAAAGVA